MEAADASIVELLKDDSKFSAKIKQWTDAERDYLAAQSQARRSSSELDRKRTETDNYVKGKLGELAARQLEHDNAANEAAARIKAQNDQMAELMKVRDDINRRKAELDAKETELKQRESFLADQKAGIRVSLDSIAKAKDLINRQVSHINSMPKS